MHSLFDSELEVYELFDSMRYRVLKERTMTAEQAKESNEFFKKGLCPHLQYRKKQSRTYTIRSNNHD